ncbi:MAG: endonuclease/exonuclease/phosphatase family protein, partial [Chloroflexota bacterium]
MPDRYIAFWNLENLFDVVDSPRRTDKLQRALEGELTGWTQAVLDKKVSQLASIIGQMNGGQGPDLLGVCEIENEYVVGLLAAALAPVRHYSIVHFDTNDERGIDVAFLYDPGIYTAAEKFSHFVVKRTATRDILQVNFRTAGGKLLVAICNHWPSRTAGQYESEPFRMIAGETLAYFHERIREVQGNDVAVIAMGDFNDEPFNRSLEEYAQCEHDSLKVSNAQGPVFYNLMWPMLAKGAGTHYYDNTANVLDQFLVSKGIVTGSS